MAFIVSFGFAACGSDDDGNEEVPVDNVNPVINLTAPTEGASFVRGVNAFEISGELTDDVALDTCFFSLSTELKSASSLKSIDDPQVWRPNPKGFSISGKVHTFTGEKVFGPIPEDAMEGAYTLNIEVEDAAGNTATERISFNITE
ncbi:DUF4625 domain-containing protein [Marinilabilia sp.]|uniref:DUF4625 domain-containing protein n=1 Tax=Marinilabilia sp. TaxID=2021252 RepID=UPI0025C2A1A3|nr:DUF4625 domain-containing protein [Marinilabilia sp.]